MNIAILTSQTPCPNQSQVEVIAVLRNPVLSCEAANLSPPHRLSVPQKSIVQIVSCTQCAL